MSVRPLEREFNAMSAALLPGFHGLRFHRLYECGSRRVGFETFCIEVNEYFTPRKLPTYDISRRSTCLGGSEPVSHLGSCVALFEFVKGQACNGSYAQVFTHRTTSATSSGSGILTTIMAE